MIKKIRLKKLVVALAVITMVGSFAGCGKSPQKTEQTGNTIQTEGQQSTQTNDKPVEIEFMLLNNKGASDSNFLAKKIFKEKFNVDAKFILNTKDAHAEKLNLLIASNQLPDVIAPIMDTNAKEIGPKGALIPLDEYFDQLPNFKKYMTEDPAIYTASMAADAHLYFIPRFSETSDFKQVPLIREDLVKQVNHEMPKTFADLTATLKAIKAENPDTMGIINRNQINFLNTYGPFFNTDVGTYYNKVTDAWEYGPLYAGYEELLKDMNGLWTEGLLDKDFFTASTQQWEEKMVNGTGVFTMDYGVRATNANNAHKSLNPDSKEFNWVLTAPLTTENNKDMRLNVAQSVGTWTSWGISSQTKHLDKILEIVDFMFTDEAATLFRWGEKDIHYIEEGAKKKFVPNIIAGYNPEGTIEADNQLGINNTNFMRVTKDDGVSGFEKSVQDMLDWYREEVELYENNYNIFLSFTEEEQDKISNLSVNLGTMVSENTVKFITGERSLSEIDQFRGELIKSGAQEIEEIYAKAYKEYKVKLESIK